ncbi:MAG: hypothetical protein C0593_04935 [Marinilabiliales bacterium]|nr:MAG: hypothetical protein C0593_04935 [Marinilabiliales bacterium]
MTLTAIFGIIVNLLLFVFFHFFRKNNKADLSLAWIFALIFITFLFNYLEFNGLLIRYPFFIFLDMGVPYLLGPFIYFYTLDVTNHKTINFNTKILHFLPAIFVYVMLIDLVFAAPEVKISLMQLGAQSAGLRFQIITILQLLPVPVYLIISFNRISYFSDELKNNFSNMEQLELRFLRTTLISFFILWIITVITILGLNFNSYENVYIIVFQWGYLIFSLSIGLYGFQKHRLITKFDLLEPQATSAQKTSQNELLDAESILKYMETEQPHLRMELQLHDLARGLKIPSSHLSSLLNRDLKTNFFDFINKYRTETFCQKALDGETNKFSILAIAYDSGFSSKSAFYRAFKKAKGINPSLWIAQNCENQ